MSFTEKIKDLSGLVALVGMVFTAGVVFMSMKSDIKDIQDQLLEIPNDEVVKVRVKKFQSYGEAIKEKDGKVDKKYFADDKCTAGDIVVGEVNPPDKKHQPAICFCSSGPDHGLGEGWYCFD